MVDLWLMILHTWHLVNDRFQLVILVLAALARANDFDNIVDSALFICDG